MIGFVPRALFVVFLALLAPPLASCSSPGTGGSGTPANDLSCNPGELVVEGAVGGTTVKLREPTTQQAFVNKVGGEKAGALTGGSTSVTFAFTFDALLSSAHTAAARGSVAVVLPDGARVDVGNCDVGPPDSVISFTSGPGSSDPSVFRFTLRDARNRPYCTGTAAEGELRGCVSTKPTL